MADSLHPHIHTGGPAAAAAATASLGDTYVYLKKPFSALHACRNIEWLQNQIAAATAATDFREEYLCHGLSDCREQWLRNGYVTSGRQ